MMGASKIWPGSRRDVSDHPAGSGLLESIDRVLAKPQKQGMMNALVRSIKLPFPGSVSRSVSGV